MREKRVKTRENARKVPSPDFAFSSYLFAQMHLVENKLLAHFPRKLKCWLSLFATIRYRDLGLIDFSRTPFPLQNEPPLHGPSSGEFTPALGDSEVRDHAECLIDFDGRFVSRPDLLDLFACHPG